MRVLTAREVAEGARTATAARVLCPETAPGPEAARVAATVPPQGWRQVPVVAMMVAVAPTVRLLILLVRPAVLVADSLRPASHHLPVGLGTAAVAEATAVVVMTRCTRRM